MKKGASIVFALVMLLSGTHLTIATHYCGGQIAGSKISFSGKLATCGMEGQERDYPLTSTFMTTHCCDDVLTSCLIDNNYTPSFSAYPELYQYNLQVFSIPDGMPVLPATVLKSLYTNVKPPGSLMLTSVDLSDICVFRI